MTTRNALDPLDLAPGHGAGGYVMVAEARLGGPRTGADHPVLVDGSRLMSPSPIPRYDVLRLDNRPHPILLGAVFRITKGVPLAKIPLKCTYT